MQISFSHLTRIRFHSLQIFSYFKGTTFRFVTLPCTLSYSFNALLKMPAKVAVLKGTRVNLFIFLHPPGLAKTYHKNLSYKLSANLT